jgi:hypothetical protein
MASACGTDDANVSMCAIRAFPREETSMNQPNHQNDKKDTQSQPSKPPVANPSQNDPKPGDKRDEPKTGGDKR